MIEQFIILVLAALLGWKEYSSRKERENYLDAILSKDAVDMANLKIARKVKPKSTEEKEPTLISVEDMDADDPAFKQAIEDANG